MLGLISIFVLSFFYYMIPLVISMLFLLTTLLGIAIDQSLGIINYIMEKYHKEYNSNSSHDLSQHDNSAKQIDNENEKSNDQKFSGNDENIDHDILSFLHDIGIGIKPRPILLFNTIYNQFSHEPKTEVIMMSKRSIYIIIISIYVIASQFYIIVMSALDFHSYHDIGKAGIVLWIIFRIIYSKVN